MQLAAQARMWSIVILELGDNGRLERVEVF